MAWPWDLSNTSRLESLAYILHVLYYFPLHMLITSKLIVIPGTAVKTGYEDGNANGRQAAEEECKGRVSTSTSLVLDCGVAAKVDAILQREVAGREAAVSTSVTGYTRDTVNNFSICIDRSPCISNAQASCVDKTFDSVTACVPINLAQ